MIKMVKRDLYLNQLIDRKENGAIKIITGLRRSGKSCLLFNIYYDYLLSIGVNDNNIIRLALDNDSNAKYRNPDALAEFLYAQIANQNEMYYVFLDEVQFAISDEELKSKQPLRIYGILNGLLSLDNVDVYITGSNSKFLSSDVATEFRGRGDEIRVNPLSFSEFYSAYENGDKYAAWNDYVMYGGMPMLLSKKNYADKAKYLVDLFKFTYSRDIVERHNLSGDTVLDNVVDVLASSVGSLSNPKKIANTFLSNKIKATDKTIANYIEFLEDAFLIHKAQRYNIKGRKYVDSPFKYYFSDIGLRNARLNFRQTEKNHIMENIIYNELIMRGYSVDVGIVEHTIKTEEGKQKKCQLEVDFVCNMASNRYYIQSAFSIPDSAKLAQEEAPLDKIDDSFKKIIVTADLTNPWHNEKGYLVVNIIDFLLNPNSLEL